MTKNFDWLMDYTSEAIIPLMIMYRKKCNFGAVIYRDPVDYQTPLKALTLQQKIQIYDQAEKERIMEIHELNSEGFEAFVQKKESNYDRKTYPIDKNVYIQFNKEFEFILNELMKIDCGGGNDEPEDWAGALQIALNDLDWHEESTKCIFWISDSNAHGKKFCGYDNHNEEEIKLSALVEQMASSGIHFIGINFVSEKSRGCEKTLNEIRNIYEGCNGLLFTVKEVDVSDVEEVDISNIFEKIINKPILYY